MSSAMIKVCSGAKGASSMDTATNSRLPPKMVIAIKNGYQKENPSLCISIP